MSRKRLRDAECIMTRESNEPTREQRVNEVIADYLRAADAGQAPDRKELLTRHADLADELRSFLADHDRASHLVASPAEAPTLAPGEAPADPSLGTVRYFGDYELLREIARGGMGVVYKARQASLNRVVALKMILTGQLAGPEDVQRFRLEAQTAAALQHPNIVAIHEVGEYQGQHYFSMDLVEGQSLADLVRDNPLPPEQAARWVRTVALAIAYAHERGVLHRDLKPSNVLIDGFGQPRVTDFGLAKRIDKDAGLTATGAVVGTPSYMPPEQASGQRGAMSPASDVYSLGAVLYELVTGRPPFRAATPLDTLLQVLEAEPAPPRLLNPAVGRDLETIILKCLQKDAARRYAGAQELADDLAAFLEGRPIKARRPGLAERALRWAQTQRRSAALIVLTAVASGLLLAGGLIGWNWYAESRLGRLALSTTGAPFRVDVLDEDGRPVVKPFPTGIPGLETEPVALPPGDWTVALSAPAARGESYRMLVQSGMKYHFDLVPDARQLWDPLRLPLGDWIEMIDAGGRTDLVVVGGNGLTRLNGATREPVKEWGSGPPAETAPGRLPGFNWQLDMRAQDRPRLVRPAPVIDGGPLLVWASRLSPSLLAASGKTGRLLWWHRARLTPPGVQEAQIDRSQNNVLGYSGKTIGEPLLTTVDGKPAVLVLFATVEEPLLVHDRPNDPGRFVHTEPQELLEAIDARTGKSLWPPVSLRGRESFNLPDEQRSVMGLARLDGRPVAAVVAGPKLLGIDVTSGETLREYDLGPVIGPAAAGGVRAQPRFGRFGSPREPAVLFSYSAGPSFVGYDVTVAAVSLEKGLVLWQKTVTVAQFSGQAGLQAEPLIADLDGDGEPEVILSYCQPSGTQGVIEVLDGASGEVRWSYHFPIVNAVFLRPGEWLRMVVGPDLDGDGRRELFVASRFRPRSGSEERLFVEALSGRDGRPLWRWSTPLRAGHALEALSWWDQPGSDGWPQVVVPLSVHLGPPGGELTYVLSAGSGRLTQQLGSLTSVQPADLNGDGLPDLLVTRPDGSLIPLRGTAPEAWRRLGGWLAVGDLDGDGVCDAISSLGDASGTVAVSGRDGHVLWQAGVVAESVKPLLATYGDLDGDGTPDLLLFNPYEGLLALSGRTGRTIWQADLKSIGSRPMTLHLLECRDLDGDGTPEVLVAFSKNPENDAIRTGFILAVVGLRDGKTRWREALTPPDMEQPGTFSLMLFRPGFARLGGHPGLDLVTWGVTNDRTVEIQARDGRNGAVLWRQPLERTARQGPTPLPAVGAGERDGEPIIVVDHTDGEVWGLDRAGQRQWVWRNQFRPSDFRRHPPLFLRLSDGSTGVVLSQTSNPDVLVLDADGRERQSVPRSPLAATDRPLPADSLLSFAEGKYRLTRGGFGAADVVWQWSPPAGFGRVLSVLGEGAAMTAVVQSGNAAHGLDLATGHERWRCEGPCPPTGVLPTDDPAAAPLVLFGRQGGATICRRALPIDPDGRYRLPAGEKMTPAPLPEDPRLRVRLPWVVGFSELAGLDWTSLLTMLVVLVLTYALGRSAVWLFGRGAWVIGLLFCALLLSVLALGIGLAHVWAEPKFADRFSPLLVPLSLGLLELPALVFLGRGFAWAMQARWRRLGVLLAASALLAAPLAAVVLWNDARTLGPTQHYTTDGWYAAWLMGAYATGVLLILGWVPWAAFRELRRAGRSLFRLLRPARALSTA
jgi:tRNA A-37 threonylcarbamoyl transferase component Bud32/outer membrane protein assembly factor BamB